MAKLTNRLLKRAAAVAEAHNSMTQVITDAFTARYGVTFSDVDADELIDLLDYGLGGSVTLAKCDEIMARNGHPAHNKRKGEQ